MRIFSVDPGKQGGWAIIEFKSGVEWDKGLFVLYLRRFLENKFKKKFLVIYAGDDTTDEDVFSVLKSDITIRVGRNKNSQAKYYIKNHKQIELLFNFIFI